MRIIVHMSIFFSQYALFLLQKSVKKNQVSNLGPKHSRHFERYLNFISEESPSHSASFHESHRFTQRWAILRPYTPPSFSDFFEVFLGVSQLDPSYLSTGKTLGRNILDSCMVHYGLTTCVLICKIRFSTCSFLT